MLIRNRRGWEIAEREVTPEHVFLNRRAFLAVTGAGAASIAAGGLIGSARAEDGPIRTADMYPAERNETYTVVRPITEERENLTFNNFYEFGSHKRIYREAQDLVVRPWTVTIDGMVARPKVWDIDDLIRQAGIEERVYRHRCVEAWSMIAPWTGFSLARLLEMVEPLSSAKYVRFETFNDKDMASGQRQTWYPWPYTEGVTIEEAANELPFMVTGAYGKPLAKQMGAPLRLALPWKYGFKSIKSIVRISFTDERPKSFWEALQSKEYGFWANVNPEVDHPRWSQATEEVLGEGGKRIPTVIFNGYGEFVADLYKGQEDARATWM